MRRITSVLLAVCALAPAVALADDTVPLSPSDVVYIMAGRRGAIRKKCYEDRADKSDTSMKIDFSVVPTGLVGDAIPHETSGSQEIIDCVVAEVRRTVFPASSSGGRFRWPFIFKGP